MSSPTASPAQIPAHASRRQVLPVVISALSGTPGLVIKIVLLSMSNALAIWAAYALVTRHNWLAVGVLAAVTVLIDVIYLSRRRGAIPLKFLVPGTLLLVAFQVIPIIYTIDVAFTNYSTGHLVTKADAIPQIVGQSLQQTADGASYTLAVGKGSGGYAFILRDQTTGKLYIGTRHRPDARGGRFRHGQGRPDHRREGLHDRQGSRRGLGPPGRPSQDLRRAVRQGHGDHDLRRLERVRRTTDTALRREARRDGQPRQRRDLPRRTVRASSRTRRTARCSRVGGRTSAAATSPRSSATRSVRRPFLNVLWWTFRFAAGTVLLAVLDRPLPRDLPRQERHALPAGVPLDPHHPVGRAGRPLAARLGRPAQRLVRCRQPDRSTSTSRGCSTRPWRRSRASSSAPG